MRGFLASLESTDLEEVLGRVSEDAVFEDPGGAQRGLAAIREGLGAELAGTPNFRSEVKRLVFDGKTVMA